MVKVVGIRFRNAGKIYYFGPGKLQLKAGMHVIVETARGVEMGTDRSEGGVRGERHPAIKTGHPHCD